MRTKIFKTAGVAGFALALSACAASDNPTSGSTVSASFKMTSSSSAATVAWYEKLNPVRWILPLAQAFVPTLIVDSNGATVTLNESWVVIEEVEFEQAETRDSGEADGQEVAFQGPYAVDLLSTTPLALDTAQIPAAAYHRIKMKLHPAEGSISGIPAGLVGNSIYVSGTVGANSFTFQSDDGAEIEIGGPNAVTPASGADVLVAINLANIFKQIDLSGLPNGAAIDSSNRYAGSNLCPSIDASASDVYTCVRKGLEKHADFGDDADGDDELDASEGSGHD